MATESYIAVGELLRLACYRAGGREGTHLLKDTKKEKKLSPMMFDIHQHRAQDIVTPVEKEIWHGRYCKNGRGIPVRRTSILNGCIITRTPAGMLLDDRESS